MMDGIKFIPFFFFLFLPSRLPLSFGLVIYLRLLLWMDGLGRRCKACPPPSLVSPL